MKATCLWSLRWSTAKGKHWKLERECNLDQSQDWLKVFQDDEPNIIFKLSTKKPRMTK